MQPPRSFDRRFLHSDPLSNYVTFVVRRHVGMLSVRQRCEDDRPARLRAEGAEAMNGCDHHVSCHHYAKMRPSRTAVATDPLSDRITQDLGPVNNRTPSPAWKAGATYVPGRRPTESRLFSKRANMCADHARTLDACGVATPYERRRRLAPTAAILARSQATYRSRFRGAYAPHRSRAMPPCRPPFIAKSLASRTDRHDAPDPLAVRGLERAVLRVVPVSPIPPMAAGQSEPRGLGHVWRLVSPGVDLL